METKLESLFDILDSESNPFRQEILDQIQGFVKISNSFLLDSSHAYQTYFTRFQIQKEVTKHNLVLGWEDLLPRLKTEDSVPNSQTRLTDLTCEKYGYLIFSNEENDRLIGILKFIEKKINRSIELTEDGFLKGTWSSSRFYLNCIEIKYT